MPLIEYAQKSNIKAQFLQEVSFVSLVKQTMLSVSKFGSLSICIVCIACTYTTTVI